MQSGIRPNEFKFVAACTDDAAEEIGKQVHGYTTRIHFNPLSFAVSALVHMYSKCGNVENSKRVFNGMSQPDLVSWIKSKEIHEFLGKLSKRIREEGYVQLGLIKFNPRT
ncbi:hypothetical protein V6N12_016410 [Hibiscus sabdariffa]|uniref:Pentatricopeptide repeat-containing protein n=1 Tax=Hibiscus sabdariffa TaxID=183260 RepID=A0ABR2CDH8_9ROSI